MAYELLEDLPESTSNLQKSNEVPQYAADVLKGVARTGARAAEAVLGTPGNILSTGLGALNYIGNKISPEHNPIPTYEEVQEKLPISAPTTPQLRETTRSLTGKSLEPESSFGEKYDNVIETVASLVTPMGPLGKGTKLIPAIKGAITGELFSSLADTLGLGNIAQGVAKTAGIFAGITGFRKAELTKTYEKKYKEFEHAVADKNVPTKPLRSSLNKIYEKYSEGDSPAQEFAKKRVQAVDKILGGKEVNAGKIWKLKKDANKHWDTASSHEREVLTDIIAAEKEALKSVGPDYEKLQNADDIFKSFMQSNKAMKLIQKHAPQIGTAVPFVKAAFFGGTHLAGKLPYVVAGYGPYKAVKEFNLGRKFFATPTGRKYYVDIWKNAFAGNTAAVSKDFAKLNNEAKKFEKENPPVYELLD